MGVTVLLLFRMWFYSYYCLSIEQSSCSSHHPSSTSGKKKKKKKTITERERERAEGGIHWEDTLKTECITRATVVYTISNNCVLSSIHKKAELRGC